jgi:protein-L-isoaspartate(D-aspartate) O-methyltransferase
VADADHARAGLVDALRDAGRVRSPAVEHALRTVPRHLFLPGLPVTAAYADEAVAVQFADGVATSSASQPSMIAIMLEQLDLRPGHRVLEIGAGTGYNAALMASVVGPAGAVTSVDIDEELVDRAAVQLADAGVRTVELVAADGALGYAPRAPYDRIVLTVGSDDVRPEWVAQLAPGGRLLLPLSVHGSQLSIAFDLGPDGLLRSDSVRSCAFIRLRGEAASPEASVVLEGTGFALQPVERDPGPEPAMATAALDEPGELVASAVQLGSMDVWDGFGLWLALTEPGSCRMLATEPEADPSRGLVAFERAGGTVALAAGPEDALPGLAAVVPQPGTTPGPGMVGVRPFGPGGPVLAARLLAALERWAAAGRPEAMDWQFTVVPRRDADVVPAGGIVLAKRHCTLLAALPQRPPAPAWEDARAHTGSPAQPDR